MVKANMRVWGSLCEAFYLCLCLHIFQNKKKKEASENRSLLTNWERGCLCALGVQGRTVKGRPKAAQACGLSSPNRLTLGNFGATQGYEAA